MEYTSDNLLHFRLKKDLDGYFVAGVYLNGMKQGELPTGAKDSEEAKELIKNILRVMFEHLRDDPDAQIEKLIFVAK